MRRTGHFFGMNFKPRTFLAFVLAWSIVFIPLAHSAVMEIDAMAQGAVHQHNEHGASAHHHDGEQATAHDDGCHHDSENEAPPSDKSEPCTMCQSHPMCHTVVLPEQPFALNIPPVEEFEATLFPAATFRTDKPDIKPPRI